MLVLTRKAQEKIRIGDDVVITVLKTKGKAVRLGIEAPDEMRVLRGELAFEADDQTESPDDDQSATQTLHARVPRSKAAGVVPALVGQRGPLAGMLNAASASGR